MLALKKVAVTGDLAAGKSLVCRFLQELGAYLVSADQIVHKLFLTEDIIQQVVELLGTDVLVEGVIDRLKVAQIVFNNSEKLVALEKILHPKVREEIEKAYKQASHFYPLPPLFLAEVPLLYESSFDDFFDDVLYVTADLPLCKQRYNVRTKNDEKEYLLRQTRQWSSEKKQKKASFIIKNNNSIMDLKKKVFEFFNYYINKVN